MDEETVGSVEEQTTGGMDEETVDSVDETTIGEMDEETVGSVEEQTTGGMDEETVGSVEETTIGGDDKGMDEGVQVVESLVIECEITDTEACAGGVLVDMEAGVDEAATAAVLASASSSVKEKK